MTTTHKGVSINYTDQGTGLPLVLLHGFIENSSMWEDYLVPLSQKYRVICIDLLGHGESECLGYIHTMQEMAEAIHSVILHLQLAEVSIIGHSMGGYVGCAFAKAYPEKLTALCLLNSTPLPDNTERKLLRTRANKMAKQQYTQLVKMSFGNLFDSATKLRCNNQIKLALYQALQTPMQGYIAANSGMSLREDYSLTWRQGHFKKGMILGESDWIVDSDRHKNDFKDSCDYFKVIPGGHMTHIGQKDLLIDTLFQCIGILSTEKTE